MSVDFLALLFDNDQSWDPFDSRNEAVKTSQRTVEELEKLFIDESLSEIDRALVLLKRDTSEAQLSVILNLGSLLKSSDRDSVIEQVLPEAMCVIPRFRQPEVQLAALTELGALAKQENDIIVGEKILPVFIKIIEGMGAEEVVLKDAMQPLESVLERSSASVLQSQGIEFAVRLSQSIETHAHLRRIIACRVVGSIASRLGPSSLGEPNPQPLLKPRGISRLYSTDTDEESDASDGENIILTPGKSVLCDRAIDLCQDTDSRVRAAMCEVLGIFARSLGPKSVVLSEIVLPELLELFSDEEEDVRCAAIESLVVIGGVVDETVKKVEIIPKLLNIYNDPPEYALLLTKLSGLCLWNLFGSSPDAVIETTLPTLPSMLSLPGQLFDCDEDEPPPPPTLEPLKEAILSFFINMYDTNDPEIRRQTAFNIPAILRCVGPRHFPIKIYLVMLNDSDDGVKTTAVSCFHEISKGLGRDLARIHLVEPWVELLKIRDWILVSHVVNHFADTFEALLPPDGPDLQNLQNFVSMVIGPMIALINTVVVKWRLHQSMLSQLYRVCPYLPSDVVQEHIVSVLLRAMHGGQAVAVRSLAVDVLVPCLRSYVRWLKQKSVMRQIVTEYGRSTCYWRRMLYVELCLKVRGLYSRKFFRELLMDTLVDLGRDPVANVRISVVRSLPSVRRVLKAPNDTALITKVNNTAERLTRDSDHEVQAAAKPVFEQLKGMLYKRSLIPSEADLGDQALEAEELTMEQREIELEKKREKTKRGGSSSQVPKKNLTRSESVDSKATRQPRGGGTTRTKTSSTSRSTTTTSPKRGGKKVVRSSRGGRGGLTPTTRGKVRSTSTGLQSRTTLKKKAM